MGLKSWFRSKIGLAEYAEEQFKLLRSWEFSQANDQEILDADPLKDEVTAAIRLHDLRPEEGFAQLLEFANRGSVYSMNYIAWCYTNGSGVAKDLGQAQTWYRRAFGEGSDRALLAYGGYLVSQGQVAEAEIVYDTGWNRGFVPAVYRIIRLRLTPKLTLVERRAWKSSLEWAARAGHPAARMLLIKYLLRGWFGIGGIPRGIVLACKHLTAILRGRADGPFAI